MRWVGVGACIVFAVVGCRGNPVFLVDDDDDATTGVASTTTGEPGTASQSTGDSSSGLASTTSDDGADTTGGADTTTSTDTSTGAPDDTTGSTTQDTDTDTSGTTGDIEHEIYDLHALCPDDHTDWISEFAGVLEVIPCHTEDDPPPPPWAGYLPDFVFDDVEVEQVVVAVPLQKSGAQLTGEYNELQLAGAVAPHLRAALVCPAGKKPCSVIGSVIIELPNNQVVTGIQEIPVGPGQVQDIDLDLTEHLGALASQTFRVVLVVTAQNGGGGVQGVWVRPRIVDLK